MKKPYTLIAVWMIVGMGSLAHAVTPDLLATQKTINEDIISLPWKYELKTYSLKQSNSTFKLAKGYSLLMGDATRRYDRILQGTNEDPNMEALIFNHNNGVQLILNYYPDGYVSLRDWENLDTNILMQEISDNTKKINAERAKNNISPLRIGGWLQKPRLNKDNHSVSWVFDVIDNEEATVNAVTIKLGRKGYEKISWISSYDNYLKSIDAMEILVNRHKFKEGYRYADYSSGDQMAAVGIANLVAITAGGNPQKMGLAALYAGLMTFGKKSMVPVLIALGTIGAFFRKWFGGSNQKFPTHPVLALNLIKNNPPAPYTQQEI